MGNLCTSSLPCPCSPIDMTTFFFSWANNCAANNQTNGVDQRSVSNGTAKSGLHLSRAVLMDSANPIGIPGPFLPTLSPTNGSTGVIKSYILPGNKTGVVCILLLVPSHLTTFLLTARCLSVPSFQKLKTFPNSQVMSMLRSNSSKNLGSRTSWLTSLITAVGARS